MLAHVLRAQAENETNEMLLAASLAFYDEMPNLKRSMMNIPERHQMYSKRQLRICALRTRCRPQR